MEHGTIPTKATISAPQSGITEQGTVTTTVTISAPQVRYYGAQNDCNQGDHFSTTSEVSQNTDRLQLRRPFQPRNQVSRSTEQLRLGRPIWHQHHIHPQHPVSNPSSSSHRQPPVPHHYIPERFDVGLLKPQPLRSTNLLQIEQPDWKKPHVQPQHPVSSSERTIGITPW